MSHFYQSIAAHYDHIFPTRPPQISFVASRVKSGGRILDVGCATGGLAVALAEKGFIVTGVDLDEQMISLANEKARVAGLAASFLAADMLTLADTGTYNGIVCFGNTLVHLPHSELGDFFCSVKRALLPGGLFIAQIVNYDRIERQNVEELPLIENEYVSFVRTYRPGETGSIRFRTALAIKATGEVIENDIPLYPVKKAGVQKMLNGAGFGEIDFYGDMKGSPFARNESFPLVWVAS